MGARDARCHRAGVVWFLFFRILLRVYGEIDASPFNLGCPCRIAVGVTGYYLESFANLIDAALGLGMRTERPLDRRRKFKVIEGGKATPRKPRCAG
jgi:hypothetical protein